MRTTALLLASLLVAGAAAAQDAPAPDYSRERLAEIFSAEEEREDPDRRIKVRFGTIDFRALGMRWRIGYLPFFAPFPGTVPTPNRQWPDPFALTGTSIAAPPRTWRQARDMNAELRRIERRLKKPTVKLEIDAKDQR